MAMAAAEEAWPGGDGDVCFPTIQRVKVYSLQESGLWDDRGTGHASVEYMQQSDAMGLIVISEETAKPLLIHRIADQPIYQRQGGDTIISWTDQEVSTDVALSFEQPMGCQFIWEQIHTVQGQGGDRSPGARTGGPNGAPLEPSGRRRMIDEFERLGGRAPDDFFKDGGHVGAGVGGDLSAGRLIELPPAELSQLSAIARVVTDVSPFGRDKLASLLMAGGYVRRLLELFRMCEDVEDAASLTWLFHVIKGAILLNDAALLDTLLAEDCIMDVVGALEYDPDLPARQPHRAYLRDAVAFREVVPIVDPAVRARIHQTYRIGYIRDVILPRVLDDGTAGTLASIMMFNHVEVLAALHAAPDFLPELFRRLKAYAPAEITTSEEPPPPGVPPAAVIACEPSGEWRDLVAFLQELCSLARNLQPAARAALFLSLVNHGLLDVMAGVMDAPGEPLRARGCEVLLSVAGHDPLLVRSFLLGPSGGRLFAHLVAAMCKSSEAGLQGVAGELLRALLEPDTLQVAEKNPFLEKFYDTHVDRLVAALTAGTANLPPPASPPDPVASAAAVAAAPCESLLSVVDLLAFCVLHHTFRIKYYVLRNNVVDKVLRLLRRPERALQAAAVRFLRTCVGLKDDFYNRYLVKNNLFEPVLAAFAANGPRYNLLNSAVLELVDWIRKEQLKILIDHLVEAHAPKWAAVDYVDTFKVLQLRYDQLKEGVPPADAPPHVSDAAYGLSAARQYNAAVAIARRRREDRVPDAAEEDYFSESDVEGAVGDPPRPRSPLGGVPARQLEQRRIYFARGAAAVGEPPLGGLGGGDDHGTDDHWLPPAVGDKPRAGSRSPPPPATVTAPVAAPKAGGAGGGTWETTPATASDALVHIVRPIVLQRREGGGVLGRPGGGGLTFSLSLGGSQAARPQAAAVVVEDTRPRPPDADLCLVPSRPMSAPLVDYADEDEPAVDPPAAERKRQREAPASDPDDAGAVR